MKGFGKILICLMISMVLARCKKESTPTPTPPPPLKEVRISNLSYAPSIIGVKTYSPTYSIAGTIDFTDANGGVSYLRFTTSDGGDTTILVSDGGGITSGTITGNFEFLRPDTPQHYSFEIWIIDAKGKESNKLGGQIQIIYDDRAEDWWGIYDQDHVMNKVAWLNHGYIAVGPLGRLETSTNGASWTKQVSGISEELNGITWSGTQYLAVGRRNSVITSPDGMNWTTRKLGGITDGYLKSIASSGNMFVAVGSAYSYAPDYPEILVSSDGITWSDNLYTTQMIGGLLTSVIWSGTQFVAVGKGIDAGYPFMLILTSGDGLTWTDRSLHSPSVSLSDVVWTGSRYVAVGGSTVATSPDGITWDNRQDPYLQYARSISYSGKKYAVAGDGGVFASDDAVNWHQTYPQGTANIDFLKSIAWSPENHNYVAVGLYFSPYIISP